MDRYEDQQAMGSGTNQLIWRHSMATIHNAGQNRWVVDMSSPDESRVTVEVHMNLETANKIVERETRRIAALNPGRDDLEPQTVASAVLTVLGLFAAGNRL